MLEKCHWYRFTSLTLFFSACLKPKKKTGEGKEVKVRWSVGLVTESRDQGASVTLPFHEPRGNCSYPLIPWEFIPSSLPIKLEYDRTTSSIRSFRYDDLPIIHATERLFLSKYYIIFSAHKRISGMKEREKETRERKRNRKMQYVHTYTGCAKKENLLVERVCHMVSQ